MGNTLKTYLEIKVPISFDAPWFLELRESLKDIPVRWQKGFYHITMAFLDDTQNLPNVEAIMHKYLDHANAVTITFDKLDVFTASNRMLIVYLTTTSIPKTFQTLVDDIRDEIGSTGSNIQSEFRLHVTLGRIKDSGTELSVIQKIIGTVPLSPFSLTLDDVEYRIFRGETLYESRLNK